MAGGRDVASVQGHAPTFGSVVGVIEGEVAPPLAVVVPEVMVFILPVDPDCQLGLIHNVLSFRSLVLITHNVVGNPRATMTSRVAPGYLSATG